MAMIMTILSKTSNKPKYNFGFQASAAWKGFDLSMVWAGAAGFSIYWGNHRIQRRIY